MFIRSERLFLRPAWTEDWTELHGLTRDVGCSFAWIAMPQSPRYPHFLVTLPDPDRADGGSGVIGAVGLADCGGVAALHVWIAADYQNRGYATEAARAVLNLALTLGHRIIFAKALDGPDDRGAARARVLAKLGFAALMPSAPRDPVWRGHAPAVMTHALKIAAPVAARDEGKHQRAA